MSGTTSRLDRWIAIAANLGVLLGLIVLTVEVRQNAELTRLSFDIAKNELLANVELSLSDPIQAGAWVKSYRAPEEMTEAEMLMVQSKLVALLMQWDYLFQLEAVGLASVEDVAAHVRNAAPIYLGSHFGKAWFEAEIEFWQGTRLNEVAGPIVSGLDPEFMARHYAALLATTRAVAAPDTLVN